MYKIEILQYHSIVKAYKNEDVKNVLKWYIENWQTCYDYGGCTFYLYKDDKELSFDEKFELGFFNHNDSEEKNDICYWNLARRLAVRGIEAYKQKLIYEKYFLNGKDKRRILEQIDVIRDSIKFDKVAELERELAKERKRSKDLQDRLDWLHSLSDCDEEFEL